MNLKNRIMLFFVALLLCIQFVSFLMTRQAVEENAKISIANQLEVGERILGKLFNNKAASLAAFLQLAESGTSAGSSGKAWRMQEAASNPNPRQRIDFAIHFDEGFETLESFGKRVDEKGIATMRAWAARQSASAPGIDAKERSQSVSRLLFFFQKDALYQFSIMKIRGGWIAAGALIDAAQIFDFKNYSGFELSFVKMNTGGYASLASSSFDAEEDLLRIKNLIGSSSKPSRSKLFAHEFPLPDTLELGYSAYGTKLFPIGNGNGNIGFAMLNLSIDKAREPYEKLQWVLALLGLAGIVTFAFGSMLLANSITRPIVELSKAAESLARGDYEANLPADSPGELGELAHSFERMRQALGEREHKINRLAYWDPLTSLPNKAQFYEKLSSLISDGEHPCATVAMLDLDRLKNVNDALGQQAGDMLLKEAANRLELLAKPHGALVARITGDKFALAWPGIDAPKAMELASLIHEQFRQPARILDSRIDLAAGIGLCCWPDMGTSAEQLCSRAELAMFTAKSQKKASLIYDSKIDHASQDSLSLLSDLRGALANKELALHYQPKASLTDGSTVGVEALARWAHPTKGNIPPIAFIPFAEQTGFIGQITKWAVDEACKGCSAMAAAGHLLKCSVNVSTRDLIDPEFTAELEKSLAKHGTQPSLLCLEVTESTLMENPEKSLTAMEAIRQLGVEISIDDFGTGYSSLGYLRKMPLNELKIDRIFIQGLSSGSLADEKIISSTVELAHGLGLSVVAEGVEDRSTMAALARLKCDQAQGYCIAKPMPLDMLFEFLGGGSPAPKGKHSL